MKPRAGVVFLSAAIPLLVAGCEIYIELSRLDGAPADPVCKTSICVWSKRLSAETVYTGAMAATLDQQGDIIVAGTFAHQIDLGGDIFEVPAGGVFLAKFDSEGNHIWSQQTIGQFNIISLATDPLGDIALAGEAQYIIGFDGGELEPAPTCEQSAFVVKLDPDGKYQWSKAIGEKAPVSMYQAAFATDGGLLVSGRSEAPITIRTADPPGSGSFLVKLKPPLNEPEWAEFMPVSRQSFASDQDGNIYVAGEFVETISLGDAGYTSIGGLDILLSKRGKQGNYLGSAQFGGHNAEQLTSILADPTGFVTITAIVGPNTVNLAQFDATGDIAWSRLIDCRACKLVTFPPTGKLLIAKIAEDTTILGCSGSTAVHHFVVQSFDKTGQDIEATTFPIPTGSPISTTFLADPDGNIFVLGTFKNTLDLGCGPMQADPDQTGLFLAKLAP